MKRLVQSVALAQGAFDVFAGGFKTITNLARVLGGPAAVAVTGLTAAIGAGAVAWSRWKASAEAAVKAAEDRIKEADKRLEDFYTKFERGRQRVADEAGRRIGAALTPSEREARIREELERLGVVGGIGRSDVTQFESSNVVTREGRRQAAFGARDAARAAERQADLTKDLYEIQREQIESQRRGLNDMLNFATQGAAFGGGGVFGGIATGTVQAAGTTLIGSIDRQTEQLTREFQRFIDEFLRVARDGIRKAEQLESGLQSATGAR
jgi:hypothetical protein